MDSRDTYKTTHKIKSHPEPFQSVWSGDKSHEIRFNDRKYRVSNIIRLLEWNPATKAFSGRAIDLIINHIRFAPGEGLPASTGLAPGFVVFDFMILNYFRKEDAPEATRPAISNPPFTTMDNPED
jgi:hypothetical protein